MELTLLYTIVHLPKQAEDFQEQAWKYIWQCEIALYNEEPFD